LKDELQIERYWEKVGLFLTLIVDNVYAFCEPKQLILVSEKVQPAMKTMIEKAVNTVKVARQKQETASTQEVWDEMVKDPVISRMIRDSMEAAEKGEPKKNKNPLRAIWMSEKEE
jgi:hypothetical protein